MFCKHCGAKLKPDAKFCEACGKPRDIEGNDKKDTPISRAENKKEVGHDHTVSNTVSQSGHSELKKILDGKAGDADGGKNIFPPASVFVAAIGVIIVGAIIWSAISSSSNSPQNISTTTSSTDDAVSAAATATANASLPTVASQHGAQTISQGSQSAPANTNSDITTSFISQIEPAIVLVACFPPNYSGGDFDYGSGVSVDYGRTTYIETNYHVYNEENTGGGPPTCLAYYPGPAPDFSISADSGGYQLNFYSDNYDPDTSEDVADFTLGPSVSSSVPLSSIPVINDTSLMGIGLGCSNVDNGDNVTIFGYPASGNYLNVSETVTQGTISGQTPGPIYKFDGAIDHGNSGGLAVLDKDSCDLGIPTLGVSGLTAGTGYIQSVSLSRQAVTLTNDQICQNDYGINSDYTGSNSQGGISCGCDSGYTWNAGDTACVEIPPETGYQVCSETYPNETWDGTTNSNGQYNCVCDSGYLPYDGQCVSGYDYCTDTEGYGANYNGSSCTCDDGYTYSGGQCVSDYTYCEDFGGYADTYNPGTGQCTCEDGYYYNGSSCVYNYDD